MTTPNASHRDLADAVKEILDLRAEVARLQKIKADLTEKLKITVKCLTESENEMELVIAIIQRYQPEGSPPAGGIPNLCGWVLMEMQKKCERLRAIEAAAKEAEYVLKLWSDYFGEVGIQRDHRARHVCGESVLKKLRAALDAGKEDGQ